MRWIIIPVFALMVSSCAMMSGTTDEQIDAQSGLIDAEAIPAAEEAAENIEKDILRDQGRELQRIVTDPLNEPVV